ncbi:hypothetical protein EG68_11962 [Paragonimus skrjabini miyazakii]|uniref:Uncharacterized protein n=1 Tax=Paragonimus skrjabini miyazakii TaxID=59628 RepID=A0A8S9YGG9_9TREM|nr:hypothetical protein EG68_11962 [Paragonimus skrjabini miyazakii]
MLRAMSVGRLLGRTMLGILLPTSDKWLMLWSLLAYLIVRSM